MGQTYVRTPLTASQRKQLEDDVKVATRRPESINIPITPQQKTQAEKSGGFFAPEGPVAFFNRGINRGATLGVGAESLDKIVRHVTPIPERDPEGFTENIAQSTGMALGTVPGVVGGAGRVALLAGGRVVPSVARAIATPFMNRWKTAVGTELAAGAGAGAGRELAGEEYQALGELGGGLTGGVGAGSVLALSELRRMIIRGAIKSTRGGISRVKAWVAPFSESSGRTRASAQLQARSADPSAAAALVDEQAIGGLTSAQQTGEQNILALERTIASRSSETIAAYRAQLQASEQALGRAAKDLADTGGLEWKIQGAIDKAQDEIQRLGLGMSEEEASKVTYKAVMDAYGASKITEAELWNVPNVRLSTNRIASTYDELVAELPRAQHKDMPQEARDLLSTSEMPSDALVLGDQGELVSSATDGPTRLFAESESLREIHGFASKMREIQRAARAAGDGNRARIAGRLGDAAWESLLGSADSPTSVAPQLQAAREYTKALNTAFRQGEVGNLLGYAPTGEQRVAPTEILEVALRGRGNAQAAVRDDELRAAVGFGGRDTAGATDAIEAYLEQRLLAAARPGAGGSYSAAGASAFMRNNAQLLGRHPGLQQRLEASVSALERGERLIKLRPTIARAMESSTPAGEIKRVAANDMEEFRAGVMEYALHPGTTVDEAGNRVISGKRLLGLLNQDKTRRVFSELFSDAEMGRLDTIARNLRNAQRASGKLDPTIPGDHTPLPVGIERVQSTLTFLARFLGARSGAYAAQGTGATLQTTAKAAGLAERGMARYLNRHSDNLLVDAMKDPALFKSLMTSVNAPAEESRTALQVLKDWIRRSQTAIPIALDTIMAPTAIGTGVSMLPSHDRQQSESRLKTMRDLLPTVRVAGSISDLISDKRRQRQSSESGSMADVLAR